MIGRFSVGAVCNRAYPSPMLGGLRLSVGCDRLIATCSGSGDPELQGLAFFNRRRGL